MMRAVVASDFPRMLSWARARYQDIEPRAAMRWAEGMLGNQEAMMLVGERVCAIAVIADPPWGAAPRCHLVALFGLPTRGLSRGGFHESVEALHRIDAWRQARGCATFHFGAETGAKFRVLARALGAKEDPPSYTLGATPMSFAAEMFRQHHRAKPERRAGLSVLEQILGA